MLVLLTYSRKSFAADGIQEAYPSAFHGLGTVNESSTASWDVTDLSQARGSGKADNSLEALLHWAIEHSDHGELADQAEVARKVAYDRRDAALRQPEIQQIFEQLRQQPSEAQLMKEAAAFLAAPNSTEDEKITAAEALEALVEPLDNAQDLVGLGVLPALLSMLRAGGQQGSAAAKVLAMAAANAASIQTAILEGEPSIMHALLQCKDSEADACAGAGPLAARCASSGVLQC
ncbi:hypothetical protein WJX73_000715 [Symbiochloris irregularis]|uniref:Nucleotide exchange factor Fes1 domain-containing protein n=1 Tax=Symbiochloris irregularis TaxID=706552 RepID=A0AAW1NX76_9CHLO